MINYMKKIYNIPGLRIIDLETSEGLLTNSNYIPIEKEPTSQSDTQKKSIWEKDDNWSENGIWK